MIERLSEFIDSAIIFAPNGQGKTRYTEYRLVNTNKIFYEGVISTRTSNYIENYTTNLKWGKNVKRVSSPSNGLSYKFNLNHENERFIKIIYNKQDIEKINNFIKEFNVKIWLQNQDQEIDLSEVIIKKGNTKYKLTEILPMSSSENHLVKIGIISYGIIKNGYNLILDDPIEHCSLKNEVKLIFWIKELILLFPDQKIQILTHRVSVFNNFLNFRNNIKNFKFFVCMDKKSFEIDAKIFNKIIKTPTNEIIGRIFVEKIKETLQKVGADFSNKEALEYFEKKYDELSEKIKNRELSHWKKFIKKNISTFEEYVNWKFISVFLLRHNLVKDLCCIRGKKFGNKVTLKDVWVDSTLDLNSKIWKKETSDGEKSKILLLLNQSLHFDWNWNYIFEFELTWFVEFLEKTFKLKNLNFFSQVLKLLKTDSKSK